MEILDQELDNRLTNCKLKIQTTSQRTLSVKVSTFVEPPWPSPTLSLFLALSNPATLFSALYFSFLFLLRTKKKTIPPSCSKAKFSPFH